MIRMMPEAGTSPAPSALAPAAPGQPNVLIVGARGGLGRALADVYRERGWTVQAVTRDRCDLADPAAVARLASELAGSERSLELCVVPAGMSEAGYADEVPPAAFRRCLEVNFLAPVTLLSALATTTSCRRFVFVLSGAADLLIPGLTPYALSKRALRDYIEIARLEGSFPACRILVVRPGAIETDFNRRTRVHGAYRLPQGSRPRSPRDVAEQIYRAERAGRTSLVLSPLPILLGRLQALAPALIGRLIRWRLGPGRRR
jgi:NAD(P)-dependent dehydrogenase (short-subunit alcohol dehydrogenase family)